MADIERHLYSSIAVDSTVYAVYSFDTAAILLSRKTDGAFEDFISNIKEVIAHSTAGAFSDSITKIITEPLLSEIDVDSVTDIINVTAVSVMEGEFSDEIETIHRRISTAVGAFSDELGDPVFVEEEEESEYGRQLPPDTGWT
jgi:hypothetical protein